MSDEAWERIFDRYGIHQHDFRDKPYRLTAAEIKEATKGFKRTSDREVRILCKQDHRSDRPGVFVEKNIFILPVRNGEYILLQGDGYVNIPPIATRPIEYSPRLAFPLYTSRVGNSEMQHLDYAYAMSIIRHFMQDDTLVLTIRGRKYTPAFDFYYGSYRESIRVSGVQTEVDAGYEGENRIVLVEAKNRTQDNVIIRQLYYPFRQWSTHVPKKPVSVVFFEKTDGLYRLWLFTFESPARYDSIRLVRSAAYRVE